MSYDDGDKILDALMSIVGAGREEGWPGVTSRAVTGEYFVSIGASGKTAEDAAKNYIASFTEYAKDKEGKIYWRRMPHYDRVDMGEVFIRSRLLISAKPMITFNESNAGESYPFSMSDDDNE